MNAFLVIIVLHLSLLGASQDFSQLPRYPIADNDFSFLENILDGKDLVLLGELSHGDGSTFQLKTDIVKYLHEELGYNVLALEDGLYSYFKWREAWVEKKVTFEEIFTTMPSQWSRANEMKELFIYLKENPDLAFTGFDSYDNYSNIPGLAAELDSRASQLGVNVYDGFQSDIDFLMKNGISKNPGKERMESFNSYLQSVSQRLSSSCNSSECKFWIRVLDGLRTHANGWWDAKSHTKANWWDQRNRDSTMAENVKFLMKDAFPGEKIIVWAANYHVGRNLASHVEGTKRFRNENSIAMGEYLHRDLGGRMYSIGTVSFTGRYNLPYEPYEPKVQEKSKKSLEYFLAGKSDLSFVDFLGNQDFEEFKMGGLLHYEEQKGFWTRIYDGVLFIKEMTPSTLSK